MPAKTSSARIILGYLRGGNTLTVTRAAALAGITTDSVRARVTELRKAGYSVYTNRTPEGVTYRLGRATRREIAAGKFVLGDPYFSALLSARIDKNLSLVR